MPYPTRRDFLKLTGMGAIANASLVRGAMLATPEPAAAEYLRMWITDDDRRFEAAAPLALRNDFNDIAENAIVITPENGANVRSSTRKQIRASGAGRKFRQHPDDCLSGGNG